jgi:hypothetical protein
MLGSTAFIVSAVIAMVWLFLAVVVVAACRMAGRSDAEIGAITGQPKATVALRPVRAPVAQPRAARFAARS